MGMELGMDLINENGTVNQHKLGFNPQKMSG